MWATQKKTSWSENKSLIDAQTAKSLLAYFELLPKRNRYRHRPCLQTDWQTDLHRHNETINFIHLH